MKIKNTCHLMLSLILLCLSLKSRLSFAANIILANQSLSGREIIVSKDGNFGLGFFCPGSTTPYLGKNYLGIWYRSVSIPTVVWVANRENPFPDMFSSQLRIQDGNLVIVDGSQTVFWSTNITNSRNSTSLMAILLDDGNLKLIDGISNLDSDPPLWQSFDTPADTWMPGSKLSYNRITKKKLILTSWRSTEDPAPGIYSVELVPESKELVVRWNRTTQYWTSGTWNGFAFDLVPEMRSDAYNYSYIDNNNESYITYTMNDPAIFSRFVISIKGKFMLLTWPKNAKEWSTSLSQPRKECEIYAYCGAFGVCNENLSPSCKCLPGFEYPLNGDGPYMNNTYQDCVRKTRLQCENNVSSKGEKDKFWEENNIRLPEDKKLLTVKSAAACESACLSDCSCTAYAYNQSNDCSIWKGKLFNLKNLSVGEGIGGTVYTRIAASDFSSEQGKELPWTNHTAGPAPEGPKELNKLIIVVPVVAAALIFSCFCLICYRRRILAKRTGSRQSILRNEVIDLAGKATGAKEFLLQDNGVADVPYFSLEKIMAATDNFSEANMLGQGGFGPVYKGTFHGGQEIAIKRLSSHSGQGNVEFQNEVRLIAKLQHRNLVRLLGYCIQGSEKILLYEYMPNKSLDKFIFDEERSLLLDWKKRFHIICGIARGLIYLHQDSRLRVIHRDLKTSNILLDEGLNPKIADFGLARILVGKETEAQTIKVAGTFGYMPPEYAAEGLFSVKSDVFSFGVIVLEILSGKRNIAFYEEALNLLAWAWSLWRQGKAIELADEKLLESGSISTNEVLKCIKIGLLCVQGAPFERPTMADVVVMLGNEVESLPNPKEPAFVVRQCQQPSSLKPEMYSIVQLTVSTQEGR